LNWPGIRSHNSCNKKQNFARCGFWNLASIFKGAPLRQHWRTLQTPFEGKISLFTCIRKTKLCENTSKNFVQKSASWNKDTSNTSEDVFWGYLISLCRCP